MDGLFDALKLACGWK